jgi:hypothetical protein
MANTTTFDFNISFSQKPNKDTDYRDECHGKDDLSEPGLLSFTGFIHS